MFTVEFGSFREILVACNPVERANTLVVLKYDCVRFVCLPLPCFSPVIYCHYVTFLLSVPPHVYRTTSWFSPPPYCVESSFRYHGVREKGKSRDFVKQPVLLKCREWHCHVFSVSRSTENVRTGARLLLSCLPTQPLCCNTPPRVTL